MLGAFGLALQDIGIPDYPKYTKHIAAFHKHLYNPLRPGPGAEPGDCARPAPHQPGGGPGDRGGG